MDNEFEADLITLLDDDGNTHEFEIIDEIENDEGHYIALVPTMRAPENLSIDSDTYYIFEIVEIDGEEQLMELEDDEILDKLAAIFESRFEENFYDDEE